MRGNFANNIKGLFTRQTELNPEDEDQTPLEDRVPTLWWTIGLCLSTIMSCAILATMFPFNVGDAILALLLGFIFSFIAVQSSGATDVNPVSTVAKVSLRSLPPLTSSNGDHIHLLRLPNSSSEVSLKVTDWGSSPHKTSTWLLVSSLVVLPPSPPTCVVISRLATSSARSRETNSSLS